jgi:hypothetical protein
MSHHRRRRRSKRSTLGQKGRSWFAGISALMLVFIICLIVPSARRQNISTAEALGLSLLMWVISDFSIWLCLRARRRRYKHGHVHYTSQTDYSD